MQAKIKETQLGQIQSHFGSLKMREKKKKSGKEGFVLFEELSINMTGNKITVFQQRDDCFTHGNTNYITQIGCNTSVTMSCPKLMRDLQNIHNILYIRWKPTEKIKPCTEVVCPFKSLLLIRYNSMIGQIIQYAIIVK